MYRLFVAIDLPQAIQSELSSFCFGVPGARWVVDDQLHLTIHFIGEVDGSMFADIKEALAEIVFEPFTLELQGVGHFPPRKAPKVLWVGVKSNESLNCMKGKIDAQLRRLGMVSERRKFFPHITVARLKNTPKDKVAMFLAENNLYKCASIPVSEFHLYSSMLSSKGAIHSLECSYQLY